MEIRRHHYCCTNGAQCPEGRLCHILSYIRTGLAQTFTDTCPALSQWLESLRVEVE